MKQLAQIYIDDSTDREGRGSERRVVNINVDTRIARKKDRINKEDQSGDKRNCHFSRLIATQDYAFHALVPENR